VVAGGLVEAIVPTEPIRAPSLLDPSPSSTAKSIDSFDTSIVRGDAPNPLASALNPSVDDRLGTPTVVERPPAVALIDQVKGAVETLNSDNLDRAEGGMIPLESLVAALGDGSRSDSEDRTVITTTARQELRDTERGAAAFAAADISGELARAVAFEVIESEAAPLVNAPPAADDRSLAAIDIGPATTLIRLSSSLGPIPLAAFAGAIAELYDSRLAIDWLTTGPGERLAGETGGADRGEVAAGRAEQRAEQSGDPSRRMPAAVADWRRSVDVSAFLVVLALERLASTNRKREPEIAGPPKPVGRRVMATDGSRREVEC
jgi:hypothetical protein